MRPPRNSADGFGTSTRPPSVISKTPISSVGAEAVLDRAQDAELVAALALEIEHGVDHVLEHARAGDQPFLGDVADQHQHEAAPLGEPDQLLRRSRAPG